MNEAFGQLLIESRIHEFQSLMIGMGMIISKWKIIYNLIVQLAI